MNTNQASHNFGQTGHLSDLVSLLRVQHLVLLWLHDHVCLTWHVGVVKRTRGVLVINELHATRNNLRSVTKIRIVTYVHQCWLGCVDRDCTSWLKSISCGDGDLIIFTFRVRGPVVTGLLNRGTCVFARTVILWGLLSHKPHPGRLLSIFKIPIIYFRYLL